MMVTEEPSGRDCKRGAGSCYLGIGKDTKDVSGDWVEAGKSGGVIWES